MNGVGSISRNSVQLTLISFQSFIHSLMSKMSPLSKHTHTHTHIHTHTNTHKRKKEKKNNSSKLDHINHGLAVSVTEIRTYKSNDNHQCKGTNLGGDLRHRVRKIYQKLMQNMKLTRNEKQWKLRCCSCYCFSNKAVHQLSLIHI